MPNTNTVPSPVSTIIRDHWPSTSTRSRKAPGMSSAVNRPRPASHSSSYRTTGAATPSSVSRSMARLALSLERSSRWTSCAFRDAARRLAESRCDIRFERTKP